MVAGVAWVSGGAGFIGSHLVESLLLDGWRVAVFDDFSTGRVENLPDGHRSMLALNHGSVARPVYPPAPFLRPPDVVYHLASPASPVAYGAMPLKTIEANVHGTMRLLQECGGAEFVFASSSEVYGDPVSREQSESDPLWAEPDSPRAPYAMGKMMGEAIVKQWPRARAVRLFNVYGPRMVPNDGRCVPAFVDAALNGRPLIVHGDGMQTRSFCYVDDAVRMLRLVGESPRSDHLPQNATLNVGRPLDTRLIDLASAVLRASGVGTIEYSKGRPDDPKRRMPDISRFESRYGLQSFVSLGDGLKRTIEAARAVLECKK